MKKLLGVYFNACLLIVFTGSFLCAEDRSETDDGRQKLDDVPRWEDFVERGGRIHDPQTNRPYTGYIALRYGNEGLALGQCREGMLDGTSTSWYPDGKKRSKHTYRKGLLEGLSTTWYANGQKMSEGHYHQGQLHGVWITWDSDGNEIEEHTYHKGVRDKK